jgi:peptidoglycan hydrolase CwlO-like protein
MSAKQQKRVAVLIILALFAAGFGFVVGVDDANAATRACTSSENSAIQNQQSQVNSRQTKVASDQEKYNKAQGKLNNANAKVNELSAKRDASKKKIVDLGVLAAKNSKNPTVAKSYLDQAKVESNNLTSLEARLKSATTEAGNLNRDAANALGNLSRSQRDLADHQTRLASARSRCRS